MPANTMSILDVNPLEHLTSDAAISQYNYESIMNGLVQWDQIRRDEITVRLATRTEPYFVDYVLHTKYYYDKNYGNTVSEVLLAPNSLAYDHRADLAIALNDNVTLRLNAVNAGGTKWKLYQIATVYDEYQIIDNVVVPNTTWAHSYEGGLYFRIYDTAEHEFRIYKVKPNTTITADTPISNIVMVADLIYTFGTSTKPDNDDPSYEMYIKTGENASTVYVHNPNQQIDMNCKFTSACSGYSYYCKVYAPGIYDGRAISRGQIVYYGGDFFVALTDFPTTVPMVIDSSDDTITFNTSDWARVLAIPFNNSVITGSGTMRQVANTDIEGYVLRNVGELESDSMSNITLTTTFSVTGAPTCQSTGMNILPTSNYVNWPMRTTKWSRGSNYVTNASLGAFDKQDYSAVMVFNHLDTETFKYKNIINYDGPDLDQGLCIMLPVTVVDRHNVAHDPADGTMIEFMFNIWPNHEYDGRVANDLIINKSQIYVYSVPDFVEYNTSGFSASTVEPIAKFSMARLVNFYIHSENVGVPDRPVCYKARFIYSAKESRWKTYDYYQLPDHIFLSPNGFVDPSQPEAYGVQTAGFPLYQNPFSDYNLSAIHVDESFKNQLQRPGEEEPE